MRDDRTAILRNVFVEQDACLGIAQQSRQRGLAIEEREIAEILAVVLDQVEGIEDRGTRGRRSSSKRDKPSGPAQPLRRRL